MKPFQASSGDALADRRAGYAEMLFASGDHAAAAELMQGALELAPNWALGWYRLGEMREAAGLLDQAAEAWSTTLKLDPTDRPGTALKLALIGRAQAGAPPSAFIEALFDQYAGTFDASLVARLGYRVPEFLLAAIHSTAERRFRLALDLGCGTGLMGETLRPLVARLEGFDISSEMLKKARAKGIYDHLAKADLQNFVYATEGGGKPDLVTAADVFLYVGALEGVVKTVAGLLAEDGLFAFSVEKLDRTAGYALQPTRRYAHSETYVREVLAAAGLSVLSLEETIIRRDRGEPVIGLIVVAAHIGSVSGIS